ncbi:MAG TPA: glycosyltransferase [Acidimicrobiales bacterium]|nr:glycosyltransferase [Acidimicrobiales bacterium]
MTRAQPLRPQQLAGLYSTSEPIPDLADRPTVYVTLGTAGGFAGEGDRVMAAVAEGLGGENLNVVVTGTAAGSSVAMPPNIHVRRFVPLADLLPRCRLVVSHAGAGTVLAALQMGLPQVMLPMGADQFRNATAVEQAAGIQVSATDLDAAALRTAVLALLEDTTAAVAATRIQNEIADMPHARSAISVVEHLSS